MGVNVVLPVMRVASSSTKDLIVSVLSEEWPLSMREIYFRVNKLRGVPISYQGLYKILHELVDEGLLVQEKKKFQIAINWIEKKKAQIEDIENRLVSLKNGNESVTYTLNSYKEFGRFALQLFTAEAGSNPNDFAYAFMNNLWYTTLTKEELGWFERLGASCKPRVICKSNTLLDKFSAVFYRHCGYSVKLGVNYVNSHDFVVYGDFVNQVYFSKPIKDSYTLLSQKIKSPFDLGTKELYDLCYKDAKVNLVVLRNKDLAEELKREVNSFF